MKNIKNFILKNLYSIPRVPFWLLFAGMSFITALGIHEIFHLMNASPAELKQYPFGAEEAGWKYCSKETYLISAIDQAHINLLSLAFSFILYHLGKQRPGYLLAGIGILLLPLLVGLALFEPL